MPCAAGFCFCPRQKLKARFWGLTQTQAAGGDRCLVRQQTRLWKVGVRCWRKIARSHSKTKHWKTSTLPYHKCLLAGACRCSLSCQPTVIKPQWHAWRSSISFAVSKVPSFCMEKLLWSAKPTGIHQCTYRLIERLADDQEGHWAEAHSDATRK